MIKRLFLVLFFITATVLTLPFSAKALTASCPNTWQPAYAVDCPDSAVPYACGISGGVPQCKSSLPTTACTDGTVQYDCNACTATCVCANPKPNLCPGGVCLPSRTPAEVAVCTAQNKTINQCTGACETPCLVGSAYCAGDDTCKEVTTTCDSHQTYDPCSQTCVDKVYDYILASPTTTQNAFIKISGTSTFGNLVSAGGISAVNGMTIFGNLGSPKVLGTNQNLLYGVASATAPSVNKLLLLQNGNYDPMFSVSVSGDAFIKRLGVGASSLTKLFEVSDSVNTSVIAQVRLTDANQNPEIQLQYTLASGQQDANHWGINASSTGGNNANFNIWGPNVGTYPAGGYALTIRYDGNIGVGLTNPTTKLEVLGNTSSTGFCLGGVCKTAWNQISGVGYWNLNGNNLFASSTNYNVGIGTTTPNSKFEVFDGVNNPNSVARIRVTDTSQNPEIQLQYGSSANNHWGIYNRTDGLGGYDNSLNIWGGGNDRLTILQNGFVGIGTTTPAANLHIVMEASYRSSLKIEGGESVIIMKDVDASLDQKVKGIMVANGNMSFFRQTDAETTRYDQLILLNNGFVGIGTTTPAANLVVNGWTDITTGLSIKTDNLWVEKGDIIIQGSNKGLVADVVTSTKLCLGGVCKNAWPSDNVYVGVTSINGGINGNLGGYTGANGICFGAYPGSHLCTVEEMLYSINSGTVISFTGWAWISNGAYTGVGSANADCKGWTAAISDYYATIWDGSAGYAKQTVCTVSNKLACCK